MTGPYFDINLLELSTFHSLDPAVGRSPPSSQVFILGKHVSHTPNEWKGQVVQNKRRKR